MLSERLGERVEKVEVAGPGFVNVYLADAWYTAAAAHVLAAGEDWGGGTAAERERVLIEFVSANPTGPLTAASGRHAAYGDALARLLEFAGHEVAREYYFNDAGAQLLRLGKSIRARARGEAVPEDGYPGDYVAELAAEIDGRRRARPRGPGLRGRPADDRADQGDARALPRALRHWFSERTLHDGAIERALARVESEGHSYRSEGALWLRTTEFGDDQDRVIVTLQRRPDVLRRRRRLPRGQARARLRAADHTARGRPPRLRRRA